MLKKSERVSINDRVYAGLCNGSTAAFEAVSLGSSPSPAASVNAVSSTTEVGSNVVVHDIFAILSTIWQCVNIVL